MAFKRTKIVRKNGKTYTYTYWQKSERVSKKVRSFHLGKVPREEMGLAYIERQIEQYPGDPFASRAAEAKAMREKVGKDLGVDLAKSGVPESAAEQVGKETHSDKGSDDKGDV